MSKIAVDVALLPSDEMMDKAIQANAELVEKFVARPSWPSFHGLEARATIVLNKKNCLPHISLAMGCIDESDIVPIGKVLKLIVPESPLGELIVSDIRTSMNVKGEKVSVFEIDKTKELQLIHEKIMKKTAPYFTYDVTSEMLYGDEQAAQTSLLWIKNYPEKASFTNFFPHITIGYGEIENVPFPIKFAASRLALCHLGNHCTCRKILVSINITPSKTGG